VAIAAPACDDPTPMPSASDRPAFVERTLAPRRPSDGPPPLLVLLHGIGADEDDLFPLAAHLDPRLHVVSLRAPRDYQVGYAWFDLGWRADGTVVPDVGQARRALADLVRWLEAAPARLGVDPRRVYLLGFSQGAMMSLGVLRTAPRRLAGVIALSGRASPEVFPGDAPAADVAAVPLFVAHGTVDDVLPIANGRATRDLLEGLVDDFTYREYPIGHGIGPEELRDVAAWLGRRLDRSPVS
jgi:phospholipase/carboxylesterase